ncbi:hypothetical protein G6F57_021118 [Rhizopus arrhizus]|nr:hypothetical protein G6F57_021118 [Rhizopus arrhizus]
MQGEDHVHVQPRQHDGGGRGQHVHHAARIAFAAQFHPQRHHHHAGQRHAAPQHAHAPHVLLLGMHAHGRRAGLAERAGRHHQEHQRSRIEAQQQRQAGRAAQHVGDAARHHEQQAAPHQPPVRMEDGQAFAGRRGVVGVRIVRNGLRHGGSYAARVLR